MEADDDAVGGCPEHREQDEEKWKKIIKEIDIDSPKNEGKNHLDLCCGNGRLIRKVFIPFKHQFGNHTGVDISSKLLENFKKNQVYQENQSKIDIIHNDILKYNAEGKTFSLVTASWCLGFF